MITVNSRAYKGEIQKSWKTELRERNGSMLELVGVFETEVVHSQLGLIRPGTISYEYYWLDRWYNVFRFHEPDGTFRNYYCNINMPPELNDNVLDYVDLDIDLIVNDSGSYSVLDQDEFEENAAKFGYSYYVREKTQTTLTELIGLIAQREFPFDYLVSLQQNTDRDVL